MRGELNLKWDLDAAELQRRKPAGIANFEEYLEFLDLFKADPEKLRQLKPFREPFRLRAR